VQTNAIRAGLMAVVPASLLGLYTWQQLRLRVCGRPTIDIALLKSVTAYDGCNKNDAHIVRFWRVMEERFDESQRAKFIQFVWARSRLPIHKSDFDKPFRISALPQSMAAPDKFLPISHTVCHSFIFAFVCRGLKRYNITWYANIVLLLH
jgi:hypothetical protein